MTVLSHSAPSRACHFLSGRSDRFAPSVYKLKHPSDEDCTAQFVDGQAEPSRPKGEDFEDGMWGGTSSDTCQPYVILAPLWAS